MMPLEMLITVAIITIVIFLIIFITVAYLAIKGYVEASKEHEQRREEQKIRIAAMNKRHEEMMKRLEEKSELRKMKQDAQKQFGWKNEQ
ncbi:hypothetical protein ERX35_007915 [Macrococcus equipercicus]|uniref:DUF3552 domain-containing protein n=1 Tax=Macrococcus equipercicus TaxID=69967 RepID=A0ABQ6R7R2_9STAP|nr:hypothetical protein [Macrococcus equipercicus]KAA1039131.1 hypothetical protein ERX35_007915 [Macrococcus equipercicus]